MDLSSVGILFVRMEGPPEVVRDASMAVHGMAAESFETHTIEEGLASRRCL
jgi:hypothetical protein